MEKILIKRGINAYQLVYMDGNFVSAFDSAPDGIIAVGQFDQENIKKLSKISSNIIFLDSCPDPKKYDSVLINTELGTKLAMDYLFSLGHKRIAYAGGKNTDFFGMDQDGRFISRKKISYKVLMERKGYFDKDLLFESGSISYAAGISTADNILKLDQLPTAVYCFDDTIASGICMRFKEKGIRVPEDISIIGFNDIPEAKTNNPPLTSIKVPLSEMALSTVDLLKDKINKTHHYPRTIIIPVSLVQRQSTDKVKEQ